MKRLAENSEMRLAPISGKERFMSVSSSHISQFCKAVACGACMTEVHELASVNQGCMSVDGFSAHFQDKEFERLAKEGWQWNCIKSELETECGWLPQLLQASMNTANMIGKEPKEMEIAMALAYQYKHSGSLEKACQECKSSTTLRYVDLICHFVRQYGGGEDFSLIKTLVGIPALFGSSVWLGEEFMTAVTKVDLKSKTTLYPFCRAAMVAANLGSSKTVDGIAKLLARADLEKLKSPQQKTRLDACERLLKLTWDAMGKENVLNDKHSLKVLARFWIRSALWLTNKGTLWSLNLDHPAQGPLGLKRRQSFSSHLSFSRQIPSTHHPPSVEPAAIHSSSSSLAAWLNRAFTSCSCRWVSSFFIHGGGSAGSGGTPSTFLFLWTLAFKPNISAHIHFIEPVQASGT